jgi:hypothetical protein
MCDEYNRDIEIGQHDSQPIAEVFSQLFVKRREQFVKQQETGLSYERSSDSLLR